MYVPVVDQNGNPLMPCHPARARELVRKGLAVRRFDRGAFYIKLTERSGGETQPVSVGIDPGSKKEAFTVKSEAHTYQNIQADAVTWVKDRVEARRNMRRARRCRNTPYRECRSNRKVPEGRIPPSTRARWGWKLRICQWLDRRFPISAFVVEDIKARTHRNGKKWNQSFSPLEVGKQWFYRELGKLARVQTLQGYETKELRDAAGLKKSSSKLSEKFEAHCVDSWVLANHWTGGHQVPDWTKMQFLTPYQLHRRQLHRLQPSAGGERKPYGGTMSLGWKRGTWVQHPKWGLAYVGGSTNGRLSLHDVKSGERVARNAKPEDLRRISNSSWRYR